MSIMEKLGRAANELGSAADEAVELAKTKYEEKVTPEKRAEIKDKVDKGVQFVEEKLDYVADKFDEGVKNFQAGYNANKDNK
jgi:hypothetical protein